MTTNIYLHKLVITTSLASLFLIGLTIQNPGRCSTITHITLLPVLDVGNPRNQLHHLVDAEVVNVDDDGFTKEEDEVGNLGDVV